LKRKEKKRKEKKRKRRRNVMKRMQKRRLILKPPTCKHVQIPAVEILERRPSEPLDVE
jgi:hypothetical protein